MTLAIWDDPMAEMAASGFTNGAVPGAPALHRLRPETCAAALLEERVDVALLPTTMALQAADGFDVMPGVALSSWKYPFARLVLKEGLRSASVRLACDRRDVQAQFVARVVLSEHYGLEPEITEYDGAPDPKELLRKGENAALVTSTDPGALPPLGRLGSGGLVMDLGQEWYELAKYPMVWGLFVAREGTAGEDVSAAFLENARAAEAQRADRAARAESAALREFFEDDLRLRYDDLVVASLTELKHYLFYHDVLTDIPDLSFAPLPEDEEEKEGR